MKKVILITAILFAAVASQAQSYVVNPNIYTRGAELTNLKLNPNIFFTNLVERVSVTVNAVTNKAVLSVNYAEICKPTQPGEITCMAISPEDEFIELPIVKVSTTTCGSTVYTALLDERPLDGVLKVLKVIDNSTMTCKIAIAPDQITQVEYKVKTSGFGGKVKTYKSKASGGELETLIYVGPVIPDPLAQ